MIDSPELLAFLREEEARSRNDELLTNAETVLKSYNGDEYGDEEDGRSKVVSRDVAEVVDQMQISVLRTFVSGDRVVEFEPYEPEQEQFADDATEAIQRQFSRKGYQLLHDWFKEGNLSTLGIVKSCAERKLRRVEGIHLASQVPENAIEADEPMLDEATGLEFVRAVTLEEGDTEFKDYLVPLEEIRISPDHRDIDLSEAVYVAHATPKLVSELVEMGFPKEDVEDLQGEISLDELSQARDNSYGMWNEERKGALRKIVLLEEYVRYDLDGDGIAERLCVHRVGNHILRVEPCDYQPFVAYCPFPMPGRLIGHSLGDKVVDIQRINTVLHRLGLDGLYMNLAPGMLVNEESVTENTYDDILTVRPGRIVRYKGPLAPVPEQKNEVSPIAWQAIEHMIGQREARTGITRLNQGLDADSLNKTATGTALMQAQGQQMEEYLARNFAEALARLMRLKLKLMVRYGAIQKMRVDGEFREVDPSQWSEDMDVVIRVGLGSGRKEQRLQNRMLLLQIQREAMLAQSPIVTWDHIYKSLSGVVKDAALGSPNDFADDPASPEVQERLAQPQPPSPEEQKLQAETQLQAAKLEGEQQMAAVKLQQQQAESAAKIELARAEAEAEAQLAREKAMFEAQLAREKMQLERELAHEKLQMEAHIAARNEERRDRESDAKVSANRPGGKLDE